MKQFNFVRAVGFAIVLAVNLLGMTTKAEAHAGNPSAAVIHACRANETGVIRIVGVKRKCKEQESAMHWAIAGAPGATGSQGPVGPTGPQGLPAPAGQTYIIGDEGPSGIGNIVAYVDGSGEHGLEAKTADEATILSWGDAITAAQAYNSPACPTVALRTPSCWHLPTKTELGLLYEQKNVVGGFANEGYWSSTESGANSAWFQTFVNGGQGIVTKDVTFRVRAVRAFSHLTIFSAAGGAFFCHGTVLRFTGLPGYV